MAGGYMGELVCFVSHSRLPVTSNIDHPTAIDCMCGGVPKQAVPCVH